MPVTLTMYRRVGSTTPLIVMIEFGLIRSKITDWVDGGKKEI
jgi:hypothetical protein